MSLSACLLFRYHCGFSYTMLLGFYLIMLVTACTGKWRHYCRIEGELDEGINHSTVFQHLQDLVSNLSFKGKLASYTDQHIKSTFAEHF